jgi:hypothetical protein
MADSPRDDRSDSPLPLDRSITPAERERVVEQLSAAFAHDVVQLDEFERRVGLAYSAASPSELRALTQDLALQSAVPAPIAGALTRVGATLGNVERRGAQVIGQRLEVRAFMANVELDLARARLTSPVTEIDVRCVMANVEIRLPANVDLENQGGALLGSFECRDGLGGTGPGSPVVRVVGRAVLGSVQVLVDDPHG